MVAVFCSYIAVAGKDNGSVMFVETAKHNNSSDSLRDTICIFVDGL